jgi:replicative DNA helicase
LDHLASNWAPESPHLYRVLTTPAACKLVVRNTGTGIDVVLLAELLRKKEQLEAVGGEGYLAELMSSVHLTAHADYYARIIKEKAVLRRLIHAGSGIIQDAFAPDADTGKLLDSAAQQMFDLCENQTTNQVSMLSDAVKGAMHYLELKIEGHTDGVETGFADLDKLIDGMHPNELIIAAARPAMGKTAFALNIAEHVAVTRKLPVLFVSLEMDKTELAKRIICSRGRIDSGKIRKNLLSNAERQLFMDMANELSSAPMWIDDTPNRSVAQITAIARRLKNQQDLQLLVIDYLSLIAEENPNDTNRQNQVAKISRRLKILARELHIPVLCLAQLSRAAEQGGKGTGLRPGLAHLRESGAIEQDADVVIFIHREEKYMSKEDAEAKGLVGKADIIVAKQRNGPTDDVVLYWDGEYTRFMDKTEHDVREYKEFQSERSYGDSEADNYASEIESASDIESAIPDVF